jgi:peroxiredoxin
VELRELRSFIAVAEQGGLTAAARELHLSQSALSQTMQSLERHLGVQLLIRTSTGTRLTDAGQVLLDGSWSLPVPGTFIVDRERRIAFASTDYRVRAEPDDVLAALRSL